jgi:hypothetical protein
MQKPTRLIVRIRHFFLQTRRRNNLGFDTLENDVDCKCRVEYVGMAAANRKLGGWMDGWMGRPFIVNNARKHVTAG